MARSAQSYRAARRNRARHEKLIWSQLPRRIGGGLDRGGVVIRNMGTLLVGDRNINYGQIRVMLPPEKIEETPNMKVMGRTR